MGTVQDCFHIEFCPPAFVETKRLEFEMLTQGSMIVSEYERRFRELSDLCPNLVADEVIKKNDGTWRLCIDYR